MFLLNVDECASLSGFQCYDGLMCITENDVCDRQPQCLDHTDENYQGNHEKCFFDAQN